MSEDTMYESERDLYDIEVIIVEEEDWKNLFGDDDNNQ